MKCILDIEHNDESSKPFIEKLSVFEKSKHNHKFNSIAMSSIFIMHFR